MHKQKSVVLQNQDPLNQKYPVQKSTKSFNQKIFFAIILVLLIIIMFLFFNLNNVIEQKNILEKEFFLFKENSLNEITGLKENIFLLEKNNSDLEFALNQLQLAHNQLRDSSQKLDVSFMELKKETNLTIQKIVDYENEIQTSMEWFKTNSYLSQKQRNILLDLKANCFQKNMSSCEINLACFHLINKEFQNFKYLNDERTSNKLDKLQSIEQFVTNKGGDCEDYALLFKAEYNSLLNDCFNEGKKIRLFAWEKGNTRFWLDNSSTWYFEDAKKVFLEEGYVHPVIVCGNMFDLQSGEINGHCVIAFTKKEVNDINDMLELNLSPLIEPQTGFYLGRINSDPGLKMIDILINETQLTDESKLESIIKFESYINTIITNQDYFLYTTHWNNYATFKKQLDEKKILLENILIK